MADCMDFPATVEEFMEQYKIIDTEEVYTNGIELVPIFRMKQWFDSHPPADVVQVVHGKWIDEDPAFAEYFANCSVCGYEIDVHNERGYFNFCPNCGAKMDGERKE